MSIWVGGDGEWTGDDPKTAAMHLLDDHRGERSQRVIGRDDSPIAGFDVDI